VSDIHLPEALSIHNERVDRGDRIRAAALKKLPPKGLGKKLKEAIGKQIVKEMLETLTDKEESRLIHHAAPHCMDFVNALPQKGSTYSNAEIELELKMRFNRKVNTETECSQAHCDQIMDEQGSHSLNCNRSGHQHATHNAVRDFGFEVMERAKLPGRCLELPDFFTTEKEIDLYADAENGEELIVDLTVTSPEQQCIIIKTAKGGEPTALLHALDQKEKQYRTLTKSRPFNVKFLCLTLHGGLDGMTTGFFKRLITRIATIEQLPEHEVAQWVWGRLSVLLLRRRWYAVTDREKDARKRDRRRTQG
jgi:hypothetical protein